MVHRNSYHYIERQYWPQQADQTWLSNKMSFLILRRATSFRGLCITKWNTNPGLQLVYNYTGDVLGNQADAVIWLKFREPSGIRFIPSQINVRLRFYNMTYYTISRNCLSFFCTSYLHISLFTLPRPRISKLLYNQGFHWARCGGIANMQMSLLDNYYLSVSRTIKRHWSSRDETID